jgi:tRNA(fMet)-specific endonuclease VapC
VAGRVAFDTTFLIDFQRERSRGETDGPAHAFLASDPDVELLLPATALGEFGEGFDDAEDPVLRTVRELHVLLPVDEQTALVYGRITRALRAAGKLIGANDLWIAAASIRHEVPLVTANVAEFRRVEGIQILPYR